MPLDLSSHRQIGVEPSPAIMRAQGSARCRVQRVLPYFDCATPIFSKSYLKDPSANKSCLILDGLWEAFSFWVLGAC